MLQIIAASKTMSKGADGSLSRSRERPIYECAACALTFTANHRTDHLRVHHPGKTFEELGQPVRVNVDDGASAGKRRRSRSSGHSNDSRSTRAGSSVSDRSRKRQPKAAPKAADLPPDETVHKCAVMAFRRLQLGLRQTDVLATALKLFPGLPPVAVSACVQSAAAIQAQVVADLMEDIYPRGTASPAKGSSTPSRSSSPGLSSGSGSRSPSRSASHRGSSNDKSPAKAAHLRPCGVRSDQKKGKPIPTPIRLLDGAELAAGPGQIMDSESGGSEEGENRPSSAKPTGGPTAQVTANKRPGVEKSGLLSPTLDPRAKKPSEPRDGYRIPKISKRNLDDRLDEMMRSDIPLYVADVGRGAEEVRRDGQVDARNNSDDSHAPRVVGARSSGNAEAGRSPRAHDHDQDASRGHTSSRDDDRRESGVSRSPRRVDDRCGEGHSRGGLYRPARAPRSPRPGSEGRPRDDRDRHYYNSGWVRGRGGRGRGRSRGANPSMNDLLAALLNKLNQ